MKRLLSGGTALVVAVLLASMGAPAAPAQAQEDTQLEDLTDIVLDELQVNVTQPSQPGQGAVAEFVTAVLNALNSREQAILAELNGLRVAQATAALRTVIGSRNMIQDPNMSIRRDYVRQAAEAAYLAESLFAVTSGPAADDLAQVGMAAYALYVTGRVSADETRSRPEADSELITLLRETLRFLLRILGKLPAGGTSDAASEAKDALEDAVEQVRNRDPGGGGPSLLEYVALGESYAAGSGTRSYTAPGPPGCRRSHLAYSGRLNGALTLAGQQIRTLNVACDGAAIDHFEHPQPVAGGVAGPQSGHLSTETTGLVTVSMGGNDLGFRGIVEGCLRNRVGCGVGEGNPLVPPGKMSQVRGSLTRMYLDILNGIRPDGRLVVLTYPNIVPPTFMPGNPCTVSSRLISAAELEMLDQLVKDIEQMIHDAVLAVGSSRIHVVDMSDAFTGHWICSVDPWESWANAIQGQQFEWFHPNAGGHQAYLEELRVVLRQIGILS